MGCKYKTSSGGKHVKMFRWDHRLQIQNLFMAFKRVSLCCLKKNQNAPRPSEHPPVRGEKCQKRLGGIIGCNYKTSSWHLNGFPYVV